MTLHPPQWSTGATYSGLADRQLISSLWFAAGVVDVPGGDLHVSQRAAGGPNMSVDVAPGGCVIAGTDVASQGRVHCRSDAVVNKVVNAAPGAGTSRIDRIYAVWTDADVHGGASSWDIGYIAGVAAASPSAPALPASSIPLAQFTVLSSTTSITDAMLSGSADQRVQAGFGSKGLVVVEYGAASQSIANTATADKILTFTGTHPTGYSSSLFFNAGTPTRMLIPWTGIWSGHVNMTVSGGGGFGWDISIQRNAGTTQIASAPGNAGLKASLSPNGMYLASGEYLRISLTNNTGASRNFSTGTDAHPRLVFHGAA